MIFKFPQDIYFYGKQWSNYNVLSEVANFNFDYLKAFGGEVHVWFSCFDSFSFKTKVGDFVAKHRPMHDRHYGDDRDEWSFFYNKDIDYDEYHKDTNKILFGFREYLKRDYMPELTVENNLIMIKSVRDILKKNKVKKYVFYQPLKQLFWAKNGDDWYDTGHHYNSLVKKHNLSYVLKNDVWDNYLSAKKVFYD